MGEVDLLGKKPSDLQADIEIIDSTITGTLKYVTEYTGFNADEPEEQEGNYIAILVEPTPSDSEITIELVGGSKGPVKLDDDKMCICLIKDKYSQTIKVTVKNGDQSNEKVYDLTGLILEEKM